MISISMNVCVYEGECFFSQVTLSCYLFNFFFISAFVHSLFCFFFFFSFLSSFFFFVFFFFFFFWGGERERERKGREGEGASVHGSIKLFSLLLSK